VSGGSEVRGVVRLERGERLPVSDHLAQESPLSVRMQSFDGTEIEYGFLMRTPGDDAALVLGLMFAEGIIRSKSDLIDCNINDDEALLLLSESAGPLPKHRLFTSNSSCGICGRQHKPTNIVPDSPETSSTPSISLSDLVSMRDIMGENQQLFKKTGGVHAVARFSSNGTLVDIAEDVGRHNAMDRIVGRAFLAGSLPLSDEVVVLSGRISYEMVEKAVRAGVAVLAAVGAATTLAVDVARAHGMTLVSFISDERCNICSAAHRIIGDAD